MLKEKDDTEKIALSIEDKSEHEDMDHPNSCEFSSLGEFYDSIEGDPINFWENKQKELVTSVVDYNLESLANLVTKKAINLEPKYQRRCRWDRARQSKLIESFLMNVPVPPIFLSEDAYGKYSVIDGKQRLISIHNFLRGRLRLENLGVFYDINGKTFDDLPSELQTVILTRPILRTIIILRQSDPDIKYEVFQRLNSGGIRLNAQEIRNSAFPGILNDTIISLSEDKRFQRLLGIKDNSNPYYQEMKDAEFVLRFLAFKDSWQDFKGGMKRNMDHYMAENAKMPLERTEIIKREFLQTIAAVESCFGEYAFRRWVPEKNNWRGSILASLFDAEMFACKGLNAEIAAQNQQEIINNLKLLFSDSEFRNSIDAATNTPSYFRRRIKKIKEALQNVLAMRW